MRQTMTSQSETIDFGKYKGTTFEEILSMSPSYILWLDREGVVSFPAEFISRAIDGQCTKDQEYMMSHASYWSDSSDPSDDIGGGGCDPNMWGDIGI